LAMPQTTLPTTPPQPRHPALQPRHPATKAGSSLSGQLGQQHPAARQQHTLPAKTGERSSHRRVATSNSHTHTIKLRAAAKNNVLQQCNTTTAMDYPVGPNGSAGHSQQAVADTLQAPSLLESNCPAQSEALGPFARWSLGTPMNMTERSWTIHSCSCGHHKTLQPSWPFMLILAFAAAATAATFAAATAAAAIC